MLHKFLEYVLPALIFLVTLRYFYKKTAKDQGCGGCGHGCGDAAPCASKKPASPQGS